MRWRWLRGLAAPTRRLSLLQLIGQPRHLTVERFDLLPLRGQRLAQILGDAFLVRPGNLQRLNAGPQSLDIIHGLFPVSAQCDAGEHIAIGCMAPEHIASAVKV